MSKTARFSKFCFTLNNYTEDEYNKCCSYAIKCNFLVIGKEVGESNTPHLQGFASLKAQTRLSAIKKIMPRAHIEAAQGTDEQNLAYCTKQDKEAFVHGEPSRKGKRNDLDSFKQAVKSGADYDFALENHSKVVAKYPKFAREYIDLERRKAVEPTEMEKPYEWQQHILDIFSEPPHPRQIHWVYDPQGGKGKTFLARHLVTKYQAFYTTGGRATDIIHQYKYERIAIFDFVRDAREFVNYGAIEAIKNGICSSPKYDSAMKIFDPPHILVLANFEPAEGKFSADRIVLHKL